MDLGLTGKVVFVAGASRGIGYAIAASFLKEGAKVALTGRSKAPLAEAHSTLSADYGADNIFQFAGDMTATPDIQASLDATADALGPRRRNSSRGTAARLRTRPKTSSTR